jgi:formamidopyrimidine-DNA glycosylase
MPEMPEIQAHAERLTDQFSGRVLDRLKALNFTALKTAVPPPGDAYGYPLIKVGRRGKYLLIEFEPVIFVVHLMQGGRLVPDAKLSAKQRGGQARFSFAPTKSDRDIGALLLTEQGKERRAGVWCLPSSSVLESAPLDKLGPEAAGITATDLSALFAKKSMRIHGFLRDQRMIAGIGRRLANEVCHSARISPFATTKKLGESDAVLIADAIEVCIAESLKYERGRPDMSSSKDRVSAVHRRIDEPCPVCGDSVRAVEYSGYTVNYCPTCQTSGKILADNTTSKFLK